MTEWSRLRAPLEDSFEELCCQLAAESLRSQRGRFIRKGKPDAGVECIFRLPNGDEWGWQAKWFPTSPGPAQWKQLDKSFKTAFHAHPQLTRYIVCLPLDLPDCRKPGTKTAQQRWEEFVVRWSQIAADKGRTISFDFWGDSQLTTLLSQPSTRGLEWYWFNQAVMTEDWFQKRTVQSVKAAGDRYLPDLNISTEAKKALIGFRRTTQYWNAASDRLYELRNHRPPHPASNNDEVNKKIALLNSEYRALVLTFEQFTAAGATGESWAQVAKSDRGTWLQQVEVVYNALHEAREAYYELQAAEIEKLECKPSRLGPKPYSDQLNSLRKLGGSISGYEEFLSSSEHVTADANAVLLIGEAGSGKTHLLCDLLEDDHKAGRPSLLFHGEHFHESDPWSQMINLVGLTCDREEFLGALQAAARASGGLATIYIDAVNEGPGSRIWRSHLAAMEAEVGCWDWIRLCVSVRDQFRSQVAPLEATKAYQVVEHNGFAGVTYDASAKFFAHFGLEPSGPLLEPEFDNPLFLMMLCRGLRDTGLRRLPLGLRGITQVFRFLIDSVDKKLSSPDRLDYDPAAKIVERAVAALAAAMAERGVDRLSKRDSTSILESIYSSQQYSRSLLRNLEVESLIAIIPDWGDEYAEDVRFTYQRFSDYQIVLRVLREVSPGNLQAAFQPGGQLHKYVADKSAYWELGGQIEALAVLLPEEFNCELTDVAAGVEDLNDVRAAMISSLSWRTPAAISDTTKAFVAHQLPDKNDVRSDALLDTLVAVAIIPGHPLNADYLHEVLSNSTMPDRDAWWSTFLFRASGHQGSVDRLIDWAWKHSNRWTGGEEVASLAGIALAWFLTCSNRRVRDAATKGLVRLFERRLHLLKSLLEKFAGIDDPYIAERLAATAFGAAARTNDRDALAGLAQYIYDLHFATTDPPAHFLERDYLRQTVEVALQRKISLDVSLARLRPPYGRRWPDDEEIPAWEIDSELRDSRYGEYIFGPYGDFAKYVTDFSEWCAQRLDGTPARTPKQEFKEFQALLTERQLRAFRRLCSTRSQHWNIIREDGYSDRERAAKTKFEEARRAFLSMLRKGTSKRIRYEAYLADYFYKPWDLHFERHINFHAARRWMSARVRSLGWTAERFGVFDNDFRTDSDVYCTKESIAKKYCWIALAELQARCADTFEASQKWDENQPAITGPWEVIYGRDIDPSMLLSRTHNEAYRNVIQTWWFNTPFESWSSPDDDVAWIERTEDIPDPATLMVVSDPQGEEWMTVDGYYKWEQPSMPGYRHWELVTRNIWQRITGYFIGDDDVTDFLKWVESPSWKPDSMPSTDRSSYAFLGELFWSKSYHYSAGEKAEFGGWTQGIWDDLPVPILKASDTYSKSHSPSDSALEDEVAFRIPCQLLAESLVLSTGMDDGQWRDPSDSLVAFDPAIQHQGASALLVKRVPLEHFLAANRLSLFWVVEGQRGRSGGKNPHDEYVGHTEIVGMYRYLKGRPSGQVTFETKLRTWG